MEDKTIKIPCWIARDENGLLFAHTYDMPTKRGETWESDCDKTYIGYDEYPEVKWTDESPTPGILAILPPEAAADLC